MSRGEGGREEGVKRSCWEFLWRVSPLLFLLSAASTNGEGKASLLYFILSFSLFAWGLREELT